MTRLSLSIHKGTLSTLFFLSLFTFISVSASLFLTRTSYAQWASTYGGIGDDGGALMQQTSDSGYIVTGVTTSFGAGGEDVWVLKLDAKGDVQWQKTYGGSNDDSAGPIQQTSDGGYIVAGVTFSFGAGDGDLWVLKLDSSGNIQWQKTYGESGFDEAYFIQQTSDGGYIVAGFTDSFGAGDGDLWVLKFDSSGNIQWQKTYGGGALDDGGIQQTSDGGFIVDGRTFSFGAGNDDSWILKLDSSGNVQWQKTYGGSGREETGSIQQTGDEGYIMSGRTYSFGAGSGDFWVLKLDSSGNIKWQKTYGGSGDEGEEPSFIQQTSDGGYIVTGFTTSFGAGGDDVWVLKLDANGNVKWQKTYGGSNDDFAGPIQQTSDDGYIVSGLTESFGAGGADFWVLKLKSDGTIGTSCDFIQDTTVSGIDSNATVTNTNATVSNTNVTPQNTYATVQDTDVTANILCATSQAPAPNIKANGSDGPIDINTGDNLSVTVELDSGDRDGENADWWAYATSPFGTYWFTLNSGWQLSSTPIRVYGGPLFNLPPYTVLNMSTLPVGDYVFNFAVDDNMDNIQDNTYADKVLVTIETGGTNTHNLPDTGQTGSYTDTFGEDSDYTINPPSYTDNGNGTVTDNNTELIWQKEDDNTQMASDNAVSYCTNLSLAGYADWRLPDVKELNGIVNRGNYNPAIDDAYFPNTNSSEYWSSTTEVSSDFGDFYDVWLVDFGDFGDDGVGNDSSSNVYVRCVRGGQTTADFTDNGDDTVTDNVTGLMWQQEDDDVTRSWEDAIKYCEGLSLAGHADWRLSNYKELQSIVDYNKYSPAIDGTYFPNTNLSNEGGYWTSTTYVSSTLNAWGVGFDSGGIGDDIKSASYYVRCVRGKGN